MSLEQVADFLHISKDEVEKLARRGKIPSEKIGARFVFRQIEVDAWASQRLLETHAGDKPFFEFHDKSSAKRFEISHDHAIMPELLTVARIVPDLGAKTRASVLSEMTMIAGETGLLNDELDLLESLRAREELCSTALPGGIALLHPRHHHEYLFEESFIVLGRAAHPVPFGAPDGKLTDIFFLVCCGDDQLHLFALARICAMCNAAGLIDDLHDARTADEMFGIILAAEQTVIKSLKR